MRTRVEDLHGFDVLTAVDFAVQRVREAYDNGYDTIELLHGSAGVREPVESGRGRIKWELRRLHEAGGFDAWIEPSRSWPKAASLVLRLRSNPRPRSERWEPPPGRRHGR